MLVLADARATRAKNKCTGQAHDSFACDCSPRDCFARDCSARRCFRCAVDPPAVDINTGCWVTRDRKVHQPGRQRVTLAGCRHGSFGRWTAIEGQGGCASGRKLRTNRARRCSFTVNRTDKGSKLQRASSRRSGGRAAPTRSRRVARPGIRSPAGGGEQGRCERPKRPDGQSRSGCRCERRHRECRPPWRRSERNFAHGAIGGAYFSLVWASRRRHFGMGGDEGGQYARRAISWNPSPCKRSRRPALREQAPRTRPG
jgi:hypothetical protein